MKTGALRAPELHERVIPRRTLAHRKSSGGLLSSAQSDRLARMVRVLASAEEAIGDGAKAARWLRSHDVRLEIEAGERFEVGWRKYGPGWS